ncbi:hypothetical protein PoMZ_03693 [Pyricularia oryzae]|uniref:Uncharacterized protein n=1 Tax=Pyricularia oryzae TaxID=318829 RepID=A0A4V1C658_PYROR|nr:hypothetical protein PoMZ_03693 [Pyricularia oryzae]
MSRLSDKGRRNSFARPASGGYIVRGMVGLISAADGRAAETCLFRGHVIGSGTLIHKSTVLEPISLDATVTGVIRNQNQHAST